MQLISTDRRFWVAGAIFSFALLLLAYRCSPAASDSSRTGPAQKGAKPMTTAIAAEPVTAVRPPIDDDAPAAFETATFALG